MKAQIMLQGIVVALLSIIAAHSAVNSEMGIQLVRFSQNMSNISHLF